MMGQNAFNDALDASIDALRRGEQVDAILARYPHHAGELRPLLETAILAKSSPVYEPPSDRLRDNFGVVQSALLRSQLAIVREVQRAPLVHTTWWSKRLIFASMSMPAGVLAFALIGAGGAAAATTVALTTGIDEQIGSAVTGAVPSWAQSVVPGDDDSPSGVDETADGADISPTAVAALNSTPAPAGSPDSDSTAQLSPTSVVGPGMTQEISLSGVVSNIRGNTFDLADGETVYKVQTDAKTTFSGELVTGATAKVSGTRSGSGNVHAVAVEVTGTPQQAEPPQSPSQPPATSPPGPPEIPPGQDPKTKTPPGQAEKTKTPSAQSESARTPPGQAGKTKTPDPPATPPGQGGGNGGGNGTGGDNN